jgi:hypothetical protein
MAGATKAIMQNEQKAKRYHQSWLYCTKPAYLPLDLLLRREATTSLLVVKLLFVPKLFLTNATDVVESREEKSSQFLAFDFKTCALG